jgi:hypothetical protein
MIYVRYMGREIARLARGEGGEENFQAEYLVCHELLRS